MTEANASTVKEASEVQDGSVMHFVVEDGVTSLGLAFSDMPPSPVIISKARHAEHQLSTKSCDGCHIGL
eukprot:s3871_g4.t1